MKKQSMKSKYKEHAGEERAKHGYHKPKSKKKAFKHFKDEEMLEEKVMPGIHKKVSKMHKAKVAKKKK